MQYLIGVSIADTAKEVWIGESAFQRMIAAGERLRKIRKRGHQHFQSTSIVHVQPGLTPDDVEGGALFCSGFRENEAAGRKVECRQSDFSRDARARFAPMQAPGNHEMQD